MKRKTWCLLLAGLVTVGTGIIEADVEHEAKLLPSGGDSYDEFGKSVAMDGNIAVIGAPGDDDNGPVAGAVYVFARRGAEWFEHSKLLPSEWDRKDAFGESVSVDGETIVIGAPVRLFFSVGSAFVFVRDQDGQWVEETRLHPGDGAVGAFGTSVAVADSTAIIGSPFGFSAASAYVYVRGDGSWTEQQKLVAEDGTIGAFGISVAIDGDTAIIGAPRDDDSGYDAGSAFVLTRANGTWTQRAKLVATDGQAEDMFGMSVDISGDTVVIGAPGDDDNGRNSGSAYVFTQLDGGWSQAFKILTTDGAPDDEFGASVAVDGTALVVGAPGDDDNGFRAGSAYWFTRHEDGYWAERAKLVAGDGSARHFFGNATSIDGDTAVVGAWGDEQNGYQSGSAHIYRDRKILAIDLDIKPDTFADSINPYSRGVIPVAILGGDTFDVTDIDVTTLAFGPGGAPIAHLNGHLQDVNYDGIMDLMLHFRTQDTGIVCGDESATLTGETLDGQPIEGSDSIQTVGCRVTRRPAIWLMDQDRPDTQRRNGPIEVDRK